MRSNRLLPTGTRVRLDGADEYKPEFGVVVHCWMNPEINAYDNIVAFFGDAFPGDGPAEDIYLLRYASTSLDTLDD